LVAHEVPVEGNEKINLLELWEKIKSSLSLPLGSGEIVKRIQATFSLETEAGQAPVYRPVVTDSDLEMTVHGDGDTESASIGEDSSRRPPQERQEQEEHVGEEEDFV
jgi:hypothetical protein